MGLVWLALLLTCELYAHVEFVIVSASYNNEKYCIKHLESIASQTYPFWSQIYINDCSTDRTGLIVQDFIFKHHLFNRIEVIHNCKRKGAMANIYTAIHMIEPQKVVVCVDGDDRLSDPYVLERLAKVYENPHVWMTYGNYKAEPVTAPSICIPFPEEIVRKNLFRSHRWISSHLKTFYASLFHKIKKKDLQIDGEFVQVASDVAFMLPILEMASLGHIQYISDIMYIYNHENPLNDAKLRRTQTVDCENKIRKKERYKPLKSK